MNALYFVKPRDEEIGPLTFGQLRAMWNRGEITIKTPFRYENEQNWQPLAILRRDLEVSAPLPTPKVAKKPNTGGFGCLFVLLAAIALLLGFSNRGPSPEEEAAVAKRQREEYAAVSALLRQEVANAKTQQEKRQALEKLLKHEPGNLEAKANMDALDEVLKRLQNERLKEQAARVETFKKWILKNTAVTDIEVNGISIFVRLKPEKYTTRDNVRLIAEKLALAYAEQVGLDFASCHVFLGNEEYSKGSYSK